MFDPFSHLHAIKPSRRFLKRKKAEWSSPPIIISGQKQLTPWPSLESAATVGNTVLVNSSRKQRALLLNSFLRYWLVIFSSAACTEVLLFDCCEWRMVWQNVTLLPFYNRQRPTGLDFLEQTINEMRQFTICAIAVIALSRLLCCNKFVVWNRRIPLTTKSENENTTGNTTRGRLENPLHLKMKMRLWALQVDS